VPKESKKRQELPVGILNGKIACSLDCVTDVTRGKGKKKEVRTKNRHRAIMCSLGGRIEETQLDIAHHEVSFMHVLKSIVLFMKLHSHNGIG